MAEDRVLAARQQRAELSRERRQGWVPDQVDATVQPVEPSLGEAMSDRSAAEAASGELGAGHEPALPLGDPGDGSVPFLLAFRRFCTLGMQNLRSSDLCGHRELGFTR